MITIVGRVVAKISGMECILAFLWLLNAFYNHAAQNYASNHVMLARNSIGTEDKNLVLWSYHEKYS